VGNLWAPPAWDSPIAGAVGGAVQEDHWAGILNAFDSKLTNGRVEGANSLVQAAKAKARGYGTVRHLITIAYLVAGKLTHLPASPFKLKVCAMPSS
jgi:hypothetical protein